MNRSSVVPTVADPGAARVPPPATVAIRYVLFACFAGGANLATQAIVSRVAPGVSVVVSILAGTGVGFLVKYALDKRYIFFDRYEDHAREARKIVTYGASGLAMTALFWAVELAFWRAWPHPYARFVGGAVGLALGYWIKYALDKRFVFGSVKR